MPSLRTNDVSEETAAAIRSRAARHGPPVRQKLREVLAKVASGARPRRLMLRTVATGHVESFDRADFYGDDEP